MIIKYKYFKGSMHTMIQIFVAPARDQTFARAGEMTLRNEEFEQLQTRGMNTIIFEDGSK